jgi:hypothetical protein
LVFQAVPGGDVRGTVEHRVPADASGRIGEQDVRVRRFDLDALERGLEVAVAAGRVDVGQGPRGIAGTAVARGPGGSADVVTVLASLATLTLSLAGPDDDPDALFATLIRSRVDRARRTQHVEQNARTRET